MQKQLDSKDTKVNDKMSNSVMNTKDIETREPFQGLFPIAEKTLKSIANHMEKHGYDMSKPIDVWEKTVIDGHTRLEAARNLGITRIPVHYNKFENEEEALNYAIHNQRDRRNLTDAEIHNLIDAVDSLSKRGGDRSGDKAKVTSVTNEKEEGSNARKSSQKTAETIGISRGTVEKKRYIDKYGTDEDREAIKGDEKTFNKVYEEVKARKKKEQKKAVTEPATINEKTFNTSDLPDEEKKTVTEPATKNVMTSNIDDLSEEEKKVVTESATKDVRNSNVSDLSDKDKKAVTEPATMDVKSPNTTDLTDEEKHESIIEEFLKMLDTLLKLHVFKNISVDNGKGRFEADEKYKKYISNSFFKKITNR